MLRRLKMLISLDSLTVFLTLLSAGHGLQASQISPDTPLSSLIASAKTHLAGGSPREALQYFDAAVSRDPTNYLTIFQRGAAHLSLNRNSHALEDFNSVLRLKPDFESALLQRSRLRASSADWTGALDDLDKAGKQSSPEYKELQESRDAASAALDAEKSGAWDACISHANVALSKATLSPSLRRARAHCRFEKGDVEEGVSDLIHVSQISQGSLEPYLQISSMLFYALGDSDRGISQIRKCLHSDPDSKPCNGLYRKERLVVKQLQKLKDAMDARKYKNAINMLVGVGDESGLLDDVRRDVEQAKEAGHIHPASPNNLYTFLVERTCEAFYEAQMPKRAASYCSQTLELNSFSLPGLLFKGQIAIDEDRFEDAIGLLNQAKEHHPGSREAQALLQKAHVLQKRSRQKDYYKVLGVSRDADDRTIKRAYRQLTKQHHPDKAMSQGVAKEEAEKRMAAINEAYEVLSDSELRTRYDGGDDPNDPESQRGRPFQGSPFGHGGGQQFFYQQGGSQFKFSGQGFNFPGGFPFR
ncbi:DnaJ and TPR domain protein [Aspergillus heteromorphus CBS 117.55]|uniref:Tetratricopeptide repeat and J domain-containing co-chaperone DNJ1 n=1 Tax=Aspergillus heteromorphus CBS 117.55 TaxID=1448321 RepID=A0A317USQ8_9EURO|nr:DnaJ and TPR domain protein [Aspergillus heteromorphus CBS 117.55]PWY65034.1 DnaJ and TPR domain protein [Aspergillus heteromorphus CBS 117.55]